MIVVEFFKGNETDFVLKKLLAADPSYFLDTTKKEKHGLVTVTCSDLKGFVSKDWGTGYHYLHVYKIGGEDVCQIPTHIINVIYIM